MEKNKIKIIGFISLIGIFLIISSFAYFTNTNKFLQDSIINDNNQGLALQRNSNEFIVNGYGSGTMLDTVTGLTWDLNMNHNSGRLKWSINNTYAEPIWNDTSKSYIWPSGRLDTDYPAFKYCNDLVINGIDSWRLPTRNELMTLIDEIGETYETCSTLQSFGFINCQNSNYWSSTEYKAYTSSAWVVHFHHGDDGSYDKTYDNYVTCVSRN